MNFFDKLINDPQMDELNNMVRWNGLSRIKDETVAHHSYLVTVFSMFLAQELFNSQNIKLKIIQYAVLHDFDEVFTKDIFHDFKYNDLNGKELRKLIEQYVNRETLRNFGGNSSSELLMRNCILTTDKLSKNVVKIADWLSMGFYLKKEMELGNKKVEKTLIYCIENITKQVEKTRKNINENKLDIKNENALNQICSIKWF